jgi:hypothetical protein
MSLIPVTPDDLETFTLETNPKRVYVSSSFRGVTGNINLFSRRSDIEKDVFPFANLRELAFSDNDVDSLRIIAVNTTGTLNITPQIEAYLEGISQLQASIKTNQIVDIVRFTPPTSFNSNTLRKNVVVDTLMPHYRAAYPTANFGFTNYNCLNFFTGSVIPTASVLLYPNPVSDTDTTITDYGVSGPFTFDFWIKPRYTTESDTQAYKPGVLLHLTSSYCISIHSGSSKNPEGKPDSFRVVMQLSASADIPPDQINLSNPDEYTCVSPDNSLAINDWTHVTIRWPGPNYNYGSGSILLNCITSGTFVLTNSVNIGNQNDGDPSVLCVGNYYQGSNTGPDALTYFFTNETAIREGLLELQTGNGFEPASYNFQYPLRAEVHDIKLYDRYLQDDEVQVLQIKAPSPRTNGLRLYIPPYFTQESPTRTFYLGHGGVPVNPFFSRDGDTTTPFNIEMAFGCAGHDINLENYTREFIRGRYPRLMNLTASIINVTSPTPRTANDILYSTGSMAKRLYTILPCDNGEQNPDHTWLAPLSQSLFVNDLGNLDPGSVTLRNLFNLEAPSLTMTEESGSIVDEMMGGNSPTSVGTIPGRSYAIYHRTRDRSSNQVVFFDISDLYYGKHIRYGSFHASDNMISGSHGLVEINLQDDGYGNLYRSDTTSKPATWNSVGNLFYNEGIAMVKNPSLYFFGDQQHKLEFQGVRNIHVMTINAMAKPLLLVSSSNPSFLNGVLDANLGYTPASSTDERYVIITGVNLHDENLNVIARTKIAQPIIKYSSDKMMFKVKMDF